MFRSSGSFTVLYQRIFFDWDIADGTYTPQELRKARLRVFRWGAECAYTIIVSERGIEYAGDVPSELQRAPHETVNRQKAAV